VGVHTVISCFGSSATAVDDSFDPCVGDTAEKDRDTVAPPAWWRTAIAVSMFIS
jgi:hypothetical protein